MADCTYGLPKECREPRTPSEWIGYYNLRWWILRRPWDQPPGSERDEYETDAVHACVFDEDGEVLGVGRLHRLDDEAAQVRYMAVVESQRGRGIGRRILLYLEGEARRLRIGRIVLHARESSIPFYEHCGYAVTGRAHILFGEIPHVVMEKHLD